MTFRGMIVELSADDRDKSFSEDTVVVVWWQYDDNDADKSVCEDTMEGWWGELCPEWGSEKL